MSHVASVTCYANGCRLPACRTAHAVRARERRRLAAYGQWVPRSIPIIGARRRIEALMCLGWSMRSLSRQLGLTPDRLSIMLATYNGISPRNHARVVALYDRLWDQQPPQRTTGERITVKRSIGRAQRLGYLPPLAWDDDTIDEMDKKQIDKFNSERNNYTFMNLPEDGPFIDEIAVSEAVAGRPVTLTKPEMTEAMVRLTRMGYSAKQIAEQLGTNKRLVTRRRSETRRQDAA